MPTAPKLVAALFFAALAWIVADYYATGLPQGTQDGLLRPVSSAMGLIWGWRVSGRLAGKGYGEAAANGPRTAITAAFWVLVIFSVYDMLVLSTKMRYEGPIEALLGAAGIMLDYSRLLLNPWVIATGVGGGALGGLITEWAAKRWS